MKTAVSLIALVASSAVVASEFNSRSNGGVSPVLARMHVSHAKARREAGGKVFKRCKPKNTAPSPNPAPAPAPAPAPSPPAPAPAPPKNDPPAPPSGGNGGNTGGVIKVKTSGCGDIGAVAKTVKDAGPNGSEDWLNCGIESGGWKPPMIDLITKDLDDEFSNPNTIFKPCKQYRDIIYDAANSNGLPPIMIASIMMQESTCNKDTVGGGGEQGLMQITKDKCGGAPGGNCKDPWFNIHTGANYLKGQIDGCGGNVLQAVGSYNGWFPGLTHGKATAAANSDCCRCQNNLDYLQQFFNGWLVGLDAYGSGLGTYNNLAVCHD